MESAKTFEARWARIMLAVNAKSDSALARELGILPQSVTAARKREQIPGAWIETVAEKKQVSADWLLFGKGAMFTTENVVKHPARAGVLRAGDRLATYEAMPESEKVVPPTAVDAVEAETHQVIMIPMVEARLSAGHGSFETDATSERKYSFRSDFLRRKGNISQMVMMRVEGDSMRPKIEDGDVVLIDQSQTAPKAGNIYAVGVEDMVYLKRVNAQPGKLVLSSFNAEYPPFEIDTRGDLESNVRIIGRVVWSCREW